MTLVPIGRLTIAVALVANNDPFIDQAYETMAPSGSAERVPSSATEAVPLVVSALTLWSGPGLAQGGRFWAMGPPAGNVPGVVFVVSVIANIRILGALGSTSDVAPGGRSIRY